MLLLAVGCAGSATSGQLPSVRLGYNEAIAQSANEQLLLNLVRLRYLHAPQFFEVTAVTTQSATVQSGTLGIGGSLGNNLIDPAIATSFIAPTIGGTVVLEDRPTVSYQPLSGLEFAQRLTRPISPDTLLMLADVGWRIDGLLACCAQRINDVNAPVIASRAERFGGERFRRVGALLYDLQLRGALEIGLVRVGEAHELRVTFALPGENERARANLRELQDLLGLDPALRSYPIVTTHDPRSTGASDRIVLRVRSLLGSLVYLSHGVAIPRGDRAARSLDYDDADGRPVHVGSVPNALLRVRVFDATPQDAYVRTLYRGRWFAIRDDDLESKQAFLLLQVFFSVLSASGSAAPVLTIPVGR